MPDAITPTIESVVDCLRTILGDDDCDPESGMVPTWSNDQLKNSIRAILSTTKDFDGVTITSESKFSRSLSFTESARLVLYSARQRISNQRTVKYSTRALSFSEENNTGSILQSINDRISDLETEGAGIGDYGNDFIQWISEWRNPLEYKCCK